MRNQRQSPLPELVAIRFLTTVVTMALLIGAMTKAHAQQRVEGLSQSPSPSTVSAGSVVNTKMSAGDERYRIGPGDVLEVLVFNHPQLSRPAIRVDGRGMIRMPLVEGEIKAACKTESDLANELTIRYQEYQKYPQVDVFIKEFNSQPVAILGAVRAPGRFQLQRRVRLLELLTLSGGASANAGRSIQIVHGSGVSPVCGSSEQLPDQVNTTDDDGLLAYQLSETLRGVEAANPYVNPGDVVYVPDAEEIFVVGNVPKPVAIPLQEPLTISRAIFMAGGVLPDSEQSKIRVIRKASAHAPRTELVVNLQAINKGQAEDIVLQADDVVEVRKVGGAKSVFKGIMNAIVPMAIALPTRVLY